MSSAPVPVDDLRLVLKELSHRRLAPSLVAASKRLREAIEPRLFGTDPALSDVDVDTPGQAHRRAGDTERAAALAVMPRTGTQRRAVLEAIAAAGADGLTDHELADKTHLYLYSAAPRRNELLRGGWVRDSGHRRTTPLGSEAVVWTLTLPGLHRLRNHQENPNP
jgi:hypothetical protein